jgi:arylsulfatase A-like enzyme
LKWSSNLRLRQALLVAWYAAGFAAPAEPQRAGLRNIVFILTDDHRYDFLGFHGQAPEWLDTPAFDRLAKRGAHLRNAFVMTALCSPSRASVLTGKYAHKHGVVDNSTPVPASTVFFPQTLQKAGYRTAYLGKWHMGEQTAGDDPRSGFDYWISFPGQGVYVDPVINVNGKRAGVKGYTTDLLTDSALAWLDRIPRDRPFFLYLLSPLRGNAARRRRKCGANAGLPRAVQAGRVDSPRVHERQRLLPGRAWLDRQTSCLRRVHSRSDAGVGPGLVAPGSSIDELVRNIDIAPTFLELAGVQRPNDMDGRSVLSVLQGKHGGEPTELLYEYYWEYAFPHTPTVFALRGDRYKYIYYHGIWDVNEFYDLATDSMELHNLIGVPAYQDRIRSMRSPLFDRLQASGGMQIPLRQGDWRAADRKSRH